MGRLSRDKFPHHGFHLNRQGKEQVCNRLPSLIKINNRTNIMQLSLNRPFYLKTSVFTQNKYNVKPSAIQVPKMKQMLLDKWITIRITTAHGRQDPESREPASNKTPPTPQNKEDFLHLTILDVKKRPNKEIQIPYRWIGHKETYGRAFRVTSTYT
ncbi:uncharacterized protein LOC126210352 [Schistocerca nitens]|uniref:uncharacterized protein LOC126210352 n=1 Tax=Schistocerca nitens TaxID=7011 RepID=UPI00211848D3|nr:uncharacterized protein LOC126210352 [Schistocerca nitens]